MCNPAPAVVQLPEVPVSSKPTPSPIAKKVATSAAKVSNSVYFERREDARKYKRNNGSTY